MRPGDERLGRIGVLVRPHPNANSPWEGVELEDPRAVIWPRQGIHPVGAGARADFYDSLAHAAAVVGINTTAMIEAAILGKSVLTVLVPSFAQEATLHFHNLLAENGGFLHVAGGLDEHVGQLRGVLDEDEAGAERRRQFVQSFVRPAGLDRPAAPIAAEAIEELGGVQAERPSRPGLVPAVGTRVAAVLSARHARLRAEAPDTDGTGKARPRGSKQKKPHPKDKHRQKSRRAWEDLGQLEEYEQLSRCRLEHVVPVHEPLVLISQVQRSGGTLLSRLFDGHPQCHAHPYELKVGRGKEHRWPKLDLARPESWFGALYEKEAARHLVAGYSKPGLRATDLDVYPFSFLPRLQKRLFDACVAERGVQSERDVLDCYFTAYFNAWLDNQNLHTGAKLMVTGFMPRTLDPGSVDRFFAAYPDGFARLARARPARLVRLGVEAPAHVRGGGQGDGDLAPVGGGGARGACAFRRAGRRAHVRGPRAGDRGDDDPAGGADRDRDVARAPRPDVQRPADPRNSSDPVDGYGVLPERLDAYRDLLDPAVVLTHRRARSLYDDVRPWEGS